MTALDVFMQRPVFATHTHPDGFRAGQWAEVLDVAWVPEQHGSSPRPGRACFLVRFVDGRQDLWPISEAHLLNFSHYLTGTPVKATTVRSEAAADDQGGAG